MDTLESVTVTVRLDEPAFSLREENRLSPDFKSMRRYQVIRVVRGDRLVSWIRDLGEASEFDALQFAIPGGTVDEETGIGRHFDEGYADKIHTVGKLMEMADKMREDKPEETERPDWLRLYHEEKERRKHLHRTTFSKGW